MKKLILFLSSLAFGSAALAQLATFGDWVVVNADDQSGDVIAATSTDTGDELLGYRCFLARNVCTYVLISGGECVAGNEYAMLVNAPSGADLVTGLCAKGTKKDELALTPYKAVESAIRGRTGLLGFAIPMKSGAFKAVRFSLRGGEQAVAEAERLLAQRRSGENSAPKRARSTTF